MSRVVCIEGRRGREPRTQKLLTVADQDLWVDRLVRSLFMHYTTDTGRPPQRGDHVKAEPMFDPAVVKAMDEAVGRSWGNVLHRRAFALAKPRADAMSAKFVAQQSAVNRRFFKSCIARVAAFDPALAELLSRPLPPDRSTC